MELSYVCILSLLWTYCLRLFVVVYKLNNVLYCMCLPASFVTSADKSQIFMLFTNILPEAICCCLETFNVYVVLLTLFCIIVHNDHLWCVGDIALHIHVHTNFHGHYC